MNPLRGSRWLTRLLVAVALPASAVTACSATDASPEVSGSSGASARTADPTVDKLAQVLKRGTLVLSTDLEYPPSSMAVEGATRASPTKCQATQLTAGEVTGYDVETGEMVAAAMGVEPCFVTPSWTQIVSGTWGDRWDVSWGTGNINEERMSRLWMTQPYMAEPTRVFVREDSSYKDPSELSGVRVGACAGCSDEAYLRGELRLPGIEFDNMIKDPEVVLFDLEGPGLDAVGAGQIEGFVASERVGMEAIAAGVPLRALDPPLFTGMSTGFVDRNSGLQDAAFVSRINEILDQLHADGTFKALSLKYFGTDYATDAGRFDLATIGQDVNGESGT